MDPALAQKLKAISGTAYFGNESERKLIDGP